VEHRDRRARGGILWVSHRTGIWDAWAPRLWDVLAERFRSVDHRPSFDCSRSRTWGSGTVLARR